jgi:PPOX class probable F420-dependent enzyme
MRLQSNHTPSRYKARTGFARYRPTQTSPPITWEYPVPRAVGTGGSDVLIRARLEQGPLISTSLPDSHLDLLQAPLVATLSTVGPDGHLQVTALWYLLEDGQLKISMNSSRQKFKNVSARPIATLFILDPTNPMHAIEIRADVTTRPDTDLSFTDRVIGHYGNPFNVRDIDGPGETRYEVVLHPVKVNTVG